MSKRCVLREIRCSSSKVLFGWVSFVWKRLAARRLHSLSGEPFASVAASWLEAISWAVFARVTGVLGRTLGSRARAMPQACVCGDVVSSCCAVVVVLLFRCFVCAVVSCCFRCCFVVLFVLLFRFVSAVVCVPCNFTCFSKFLLNVHGF